MLHTKESALALISGSIEAVRDADSIARTIGALMSSGALEPGDLLPTVRGLATSLGVSSNTVAEAWRTLQAHGAITTDRRRGTRVRAGRATFEGRYWRVPVPPGSLAIDLSTGTPDPTLLPEIGPALAQLGASIAVTNYIDEPIVPELDTLLRARWPFEPEALTVVDGALDALDRLIDTTVRLGDVVMVENPTFPPILDMLELAGATVVGVDLDHEGALPNSVAEALEASPSVAIFQPRAQNPTGASYSPARLRDLTKMLANHDLLVIEDEHSGAVADAPVVSFGAGLPGQVVHVHSFSKSHGPDLRIAAIGGAAQPIDALIKRRRLGPSWTSRLTQHLLARLLVDHVVSAGIDDAATAYRDRRVALTSALQQAGLAPAPGAGINMWIPVADEQSAVVGLAAQGVGVAPGRPFCVGDAAQDHIRLSLGELQPRMIDEVAAAIAHAATPGTQQRSS